MLWVLVLSTLCLFPSVYCQFDSTRYYNTYDCSADGYYMLDTKRSTGSCVSQACTCDQYGICTTITCNILGYPTDTPSEYYEEAWYFDGVFGPNCDGLFSPPLNLLTGFSR